MIRPRHQIRCEKCPVMLDRAINVKRAVCGSCRRSYQTIYFEKVRKQAAGYRELLLLLGVKDEGRFIAELRERAAAKGREYGPNDAPCPTCGTILSIFGVHRIVCAGRSKEDRAWFREHGKWPDPRGEQHEIGALLEDRRWRNERIRQVAKDNPELTIRDLVERFGGTEHAISKLLSRANLKRRQDEPSQIAGNC